MARAEVIVGELFPRLDAAGEDIARTLFRLLARGRPVAPEALAGAAAADAAAVTRLLGSWHGVHRNPAGAVTGFWGLTLDETPHRLRIAGRTLHAWCAWDTLFLPALLDSAAEVASVCPTTGAILRLAVAPDGIRHAPAGLVMSFVTPDRAQVHADVVRYLCRLVRFFASARDAPDWLEKHPGTFLVSLAEAWQLARLKLAAQYPSFGAAQRGSAASLSTSRR